MTEKMTWIKARFNKTGTPCFVARPPTWENKWLALYQYENPDFPGKMVWAGRSLSEREARNELRSERNDDGRTVAATNVAELDAAHKIIWSGYGNGVERRAVRVREKAAKRGIVVNYLYIAEAMLAGCVGYDRIADRKPGMMNIIAGMHPETKAIVKSAFALRAGA